ncbi:MAG: leucine-rich repeat domain-containing protein, partial [Treponemataceae bacterium]
KVTEKPEAQQPTDESIFKTEEVDGKPSLCKITGYNVDKDKLPSKLVIPDTIYGKKVAEIGESAFEGCTGIKTLNLPAALTKIGNWAFKGCTGIKTLDLPASLTEIGRDAFYGCTGITTLNLPAALTEIGGFAFEGCTGITTLDLSGCTELTEIGDWAFCDCTGITTLDLSGCTELTEIGSGAFYGCTLLETVTFGKTDGWKAYKDRWSTNEIGSIIDLRTPAKRLDALTKSQADGGYCDCWWRRKE